MTLGGACTIRRRDAGLKIWRAKEVMAVIRCSSGNIGFHEDQESFTGQKERDMGHGHPRALLFQLEHILHFAIRSVTKGHL